METISLVVPCYNEEESIQYFYDAICKIENVLENVNIEFVFVDDGSTDHTLDVLKRLREKDCRVRYVSFSRNFGKEAGLYAGLKNAKGDYVVTMDVDLQHPPEYIPIMYNYIKNEKYDCVATRRFDRKGEPPIRSFFSKLFYKIINKMSSTEIVDGAQDYRMMTKKVVNAILDDQEYNRFTKGIYSWVGFNTKWIEHKNVERSVGQSKWSFGKLFLYSIEGILAYTTAPLSIASVLGLTFCLMSFIMLCIIFIRALIWGDPVAGWPSTICIITFLGGVQLFCMGIIGLYLSKIYLETKKRPIYIVKEQV